MTKDILKKHATLGIAIFLTFSAICYANGETEDAQLKDAQATAKASDEDADKAKKEKAEPLAQIANNTYAFLKAFNAYSLGWLQADTSKTTASLQELFSNLIKYSFDNYETQLTLQKKLVGSSLTAYNVNTDYTTLIKQNKKNSDGTMAPVDEKTKTAAFNYILNASALNIKHRPPSEAGKNDVNAILKYQAFYNTVSSISSYDSYILSQHLADLQNDFKLSQTQMDLQDLASNNDWLTHIGTETSLSVLLRQLLLFTSQMYVVSLQSLETQKKLLATIAMTNSLIILGSGYYEDTLFNKT